MRRALYRELWKERFNKMLKLEQQAIDEYGRLLAECRSQHKEHAIEPHLKRLMADEARHVQLVQQLLEILSRQP